MLAWILLRECGAGPPGPPAAHMQQKTILIIDDNEVILKTLSMKLKAKDYRVETALDGSEALSAVRKIRPDLILLDISFPPDVAHGGGVPWDGFRMLEWFSRMDEAKNTPVITIQRIVVVE